MTTPSTTEDTDPRRKRLKKRAIEIWERLDRRRRGLSWAFIILGVLGAVVALWPLATTVWDLLGFTTGQAWRLAVLGGCALLLVAGVGWMNGGRTSPLRLFWLILIAWTIAAGAVAAMTVLAWLALGTPQWQPPEELTPKNLDAIATRAFAIVAGLGGVALLVIAYRRQRATENGNEREVAKLFTETFDSASEKLGSEHAAVRLAGVHALARLADEAPEGREDLVQMVIDVLCAYLRMPYAPAPENLPKNASKARQKEHRQSELEFVSFREVRHTIIRIIGNHLRVDTRWRGKNYDFNGTVFDGGDLRGAVFSGSRVDFVGAEFSGGFVNFIGAEFSDCRVFFNTAVFSGGRVDFFEAKFSGGFVNFFNSEFSGGFVNFHSAEFSGSDMNFGSAKFSGGWVYFNSAVFSGGEIHFGEALLSDGKVSFDKVSGKCPDGLLKAIKEGKSEVVIPECWRPTADSSGEQEGPAAST
ncbi:pentapeptide repeat-containing protein [Nocardiopsis aegyptia]|uniref:Uncharacterized protein YjbI with pentapeptide repeats n=1 Tax=Nocardiopsis aegyptia TaxID=220378 RepID=A0A7Z0EHW0_9ACTN|nr:pentapeptide repeat-containing protein [Nocardiopsis aegyptia]NYJ32199.1 uncharacterized protein YjbI with pentapeptide repeats [Nocardiopsis aegyptia]